MEATIITLRARGAKTAGIDGITKDDVEKDIENFARSIALELREGCYTPQPVRRIYIKKPNGKLRLLGIPTIRDRVVQRAMLMVMDPIWESDFHNMSYGFRPKRSVHQAIRTAKLQLQDTGLYSKGRWIIEGDLSSYFDTIHHKLLIKAVRKRIKDKRFITLLWKFMKAGHVDKGMFCASHNGVPQGGVISPLLANIMLNEFDEYLEKRYLAPKVRKDRWSWNHSIKLNRPIAIKEKRQWKPAVAYCRYADDFFVIVKGNRAQVESIREECKVFLEEKLHLTLNMDKIHITHANDGFIFLGHRIIRKRGPKGIMRVTDGIPHEKVRNFCTRLAKYRSHIKPLMRKWVVHPEPGNAKTWVLHGTTAQGKVCRAVLSCLIGRGKRQFRWKKETVNPYLCESTSKTGAPTSRYRDIAMALSHC